MSYETIERDGLTFRVKITPDDSVREPWNEYDGSNGQAWLWDRDELPIKEDVPST